MENFITLFFCGIVAYIVIMWLFDTFFDREKKLDPVEEDKLTESYRKNN